MNLKNKRIRLYSSNTSKYPRYNLNNTHYLNPYYITGLVDAEGCFTTSIYKDCKMKKIVPRLHPYFVTGFVDGEGCFVVKIIKRSKMNTGYEIQLCFEITNHSKDLSLLENIKSYFGGIGSITKEGKNTFQYRVSSKEDLKIIIDHFDKYPLITQKYADFLLFKSVLEICKSKEHLTYAGLSKILNIKASLNNGLSDELKLAFPDLSPVLRPQVKTEIQDPN
jgi:hypothetical protein